MPNGLQLRVAMTIDDAPSVGEPGSPPFDPGRMDRVREALLAAGIQNCVAFVIGGRARGHEDCLRRWLEAGFELGNHSRDHVAASALGPAAYLEGFRACDALLVQVGAFEGGRPRYCRHPFGDRGRAGAERLAIAEGIAELGYVDAEVTLDLYDYMYDPRWMRAHPRHPQRARRVERRFVQVAAESIRRSGTRGRALWGDSMMHVAACHFGPVVERNITALVEAMAGEVRWVSLAEATQVGRYRALIADMEREGVPAHLLLQRPSDRALRRLARLGRRLGLVNRSHVGPRWPHLTP